MERQSIGENRLKKRFLGFAEKAVTKDKDFDVLRSIPQGFLRFY
jgi:hypothetical protein